MKVVSTIVLVILILLLGVLHLMLRRVDQGISLQQTELARSEERLGLTQKLIDQTIYRIVYAYPKWIDLIGKSFLSAEMKNNYLSLLNSRYHLLAT